MRGSFQMPAISEAASVQFESLCKTWAAHALPVLSLVSCILLFHTDKGGFILQNF